MAVLCQSAESSLQIEDFQKYVVLPVAEVTGVGLKCFVSAYVKVSGPACWSSTTRKEVGCPLVFCCCPLVTTWLC